jgi:hypothetical protein
MDVLVLQISGTSRNRFIQSKINSRAGLIRSENAYSGSSAVEFTHIHDGGVSIFCFQRVHDFDPLLDIFCTSSVWDVASKEDHLSNLNTQDL